MMHAYDETLLAKAKLSMASMFDYAVNDCRLELSRFYQMFLNSEISWKFAMGDSRTIAGCSGIELAYEIIGESNEQMLVEPSYPIKRSSEFWLGWVLAHYQWHSGLPFEQIADSSQIMQIIAMYHKYHEMDIRQFIDTMDEISASKGQQSRLKRLRMYAKLSQRELAEKTDIPLRTIQQYEQGQKDIARANADYLIRLSRALYCDPIELLH